MPGIENSRHLLSLMTKSRGRLAWYPGSHGVHSTKASLKLEIGPPTGQGVQGASALRAEMTEVELDIHVPTINIKPLLAIAGSTYK